MKTQTKKVTIETVQSIILKYFPQLWLPVEACLSALATLLIKGNNSPTALILVGHTLVARTTVSKFFKNINGMWEKSTKDNLNPLFISVPRTISNSRDFVSKVNICSQVIEEYVTQLFRDKQGTINWQDSPFDSHVEEEIFFYAKLLVRLRGIIPDGQKDAFIEDPEKTMALLHNIAKGRAIIHGRSHLSMDDIPMIREIVFSSCPEDRRHVMRELFCDWPTIELARRDVKSILKVDDEKALKFIKDLENLKLISKNPDGEDCEFCPHEDFQNRSKCISDVSEYYDLKSLV